MSAGRVALPQGPPQRCHLIYFPSRKTLAKRQRAAADTVFTLSWWGGGRRGGHDALRCNISPEKSPQQLMLLQPRPSLVVPSRLANS